MSCNIGSCYFCQCTLKAVLILKDLISDFILVMLFCISLFVPVEFVLDYYARRFLLVHILIYSFSKHLCI